MSVRKIARIEGAITAEIRGGKIEYSINLGKHKTISVSADKLKLSHTIKLKVNSKYSNAELPKATINIIAKDIREYSETHLISISDKLWVYDGWIWKASREYEPEEARLLILEEIDKERHKLERLKRKFDETHADELAVSRRERIPESVRIEVWRRDEGKSVRCGSRENLEYDHIIPVSKGGSNTARNIELLCAKCNRAKHDKIE